MKRTDAAPPSATSGRWSVTLTQTDTGGQAKLVQFGGTYTLDTKTYTSNVTWAAIGPGQV